MRALALIIALVGGPALATQAQCPTDTGSVEDAQRLFEEGNEQLSEGDNSVAHASFRCSFSIYPNPATAFGMAVALQRNGEAAAACSVLYRNLSGTDAEAIAPDLQAAIARLRRTLFAETGRVMIEGDMFTPPRLRVDGAETEPASMDPALLCLAPGAHEIEVIRSDGSPFSQSMMVLAGTSRTLDVPPIEPVDDREPEDEQELDPNPPADLRAAYLEPPSAGPWWIIGTSGAVTIVGGGFLVAWIEQRSLIEQASDGTRWSEVSSASDSAERYSALGFGLLSLGIVGLAAGTIWRVSQGTNDDGEMNVRLAPGAISVEGRF